ncbi:uncharacterized protein LOC110265806 isoform X2 [Arachis ipaensis]|uniref:uncharacterized protein LOC110265806 isoform X2 n=1 Tax=Arachis ipaensis TaxID=130454 RepID=UPI000A2B246B|nr:uncharacterized protein LOC110265806 isoform X2 [Arachis ipaensis]
MEAGSGSLTRLVSLVSAGLRRCSSETVKFGSCSFLFCALTLGCLIVSRIWMMAARQSCQVIGLMVGAPIREMGNDLNGLEEPLTEEGDSGHSDSEYDGRDGGGSYMHAAAEDHANSENVMGKQFSCPDPVIAFVLLSAEFNGIEDAYASYVAYAKGIGFAVRKGDSIKDKEGNIVRKFFYCNRQGLREKKHYERVDRKRTHKPETRTNCNAKLVMFLEKSCRKWRTKTLVEEHNHELAPQEFTNVMAPHRKIPEGHKAHIHSMHDAGFKTTQIMGFFAHMCGGYRNLNFIIKDLYNYMDGVRQSRIVEGGAAAAISYLKGKAELDPMAVVQYSYCVEKHLGHLF